MPVLWLWNNSVCLGEAAAAAARQQDILWIRFCIGLNLICLWASPQAAYFPLSGAQSTTGRPPATIESRRLAAEGHNYLYSFGGYQSSWRNVLKCASWAISLLYHILYIEVMT